MSFKYKISVNNGIVFGVNSLEGITPATCLNGGWSGCIDWMQKVYWSEEYPATVIPIKSWEHFKNN
ncbi:hypothetical protein HWD31_gp55 [Pantoea phage vB_PagM_SSEM1]|uniref:Uncharacterized protein n=1 Tax=Pantoea phage vB_PagM_SSEM1 TaxID=2721760 RepID=A0A6H0D8H2_9CAUD|nr:hypothetical protein HWD31_gp55 [Pantoea phage vB_PagM_SSEM1]QIS79364.1 hypothetical protein SSEM1_gp55 [Pantoea phage vB_PagM_SSEM1]